MKVTPVAQGTGTPAGADIGQGRMPADRLAAAKAIAAGQSPMRIAESDTPTDPQVERASRALKKIKMRTQVSPDRHIAEETPAIDAAAPVAETTQSGENATPDVAEPTQAPEETKPLSPQFAALARQKRALQVKEREIAEREAKLVPPNMDEYVSKADLLANPLKVFESGVTYDQLTEAILSGQGDSKIQALEAKIAALEKGVDTKLSERDNQAEQQVLSEMTREAKLLVAEGEDFALVREKGFVPKAIKLIHETWKKSGEILDVSEALSLVEEELLKEEIKFASLEKVRSKLTPPQPEQQQPQPKNSGMRTLTNRDGATPSLGRRERAMLAFSNQLRK